MPHGDFNCLVLPDDAEERERDYVMLSDIFPTGWHATRLARMEPGDVVVVYGAGPVGLLAAYSAVLQGRRRCSSSIDTPIASRSPRGWTKVILHPA